MNMNMNPITHAQRECTDPEKINAFITRERTGFLGVTDGSQPYVVPLNYVWSNGMIYFHGAGSGRKNRVMEEHPSVCFTICTEYGTVTDPVPAKTDTAYMSVMVFGQSQRVTDLDEATEALQQILNKYVPGFYDRPLSKDMVEKYRSGIDGKAVSVYRIVPQAITAKENPMDEENMFDTGRRTVGNK